MQKVTPKKHLGQHFLKDEKIASDIADAVLPVCKVVLEVGPGMGVLSKYLKPKHDLFVVEIDRESVAYLQNHFDFTEGKIIQEDFLQMDLDKFFTGSISVAGNFPYNISSQILFKCLDYKDMVMQVTGMFQKEVAERIAAKPGKKDYGILSVLVQAFYDVEYLFTVPPEVFDPPPKVQSGVIRCLRKKEPTVIHEKEFKKVVKAAFNQRRKTLRNALSAVYGKLPEDLPFATLRAERLSWQDFRMLTDYFLKLNQSN